MTAAAPVFHGPNTWIVAKELYLSGTPAPVVCARLGIKPGTLRSRIKRQGWTRRAHALASDLPPPVRHAAPPPPPVTTIVGTDTPAPTAHDPRVSVTPEAAARAAVLEAARLLAVGRAVDAAMLLRTAEQLKHAARTTPEPPPKDLIARKAAEFARLVEAGYPDLEVSWTPLRGDRVGRVWRVFPEPVEPRDPGGVRRTAGGVAARLRVAAAALPR